MREISLIVLTLPDGKIVFQRRGKDAPVSPGLLGFFGGHVEPGESFDQTMRRELGEETSLDVAKLTIEHLQDFTLAVPSLQETVSYHLYQAAIPAIHFEVYEGQGAEAYERHEALLRDDLTVSARHIITNILGESDGTRSN